MEPTTITEIALPMNVIEVALGILTLTLAMIIIVAILRRAGFMGQAKTISSVMLHEKSFSHLMSRFDDIDSRLKDMMDQCEHLRESHKRDNTELRKIRSSVTLLVHRVNTILKRES